MRFKFLFLVLLGTLALPLHAQKIGLLLDSYVSDRWYLDKKLFVDKVTELGGECQVEVAYGDPVEQVNLSKKMIEQGESTLIAVGAAHLVGKDGVIELLRARGYTVEQM